MHKKTTSTGAKAYQRADTEWRIKPYSDWHRTLSKKLLMLDVDFIEWRYRHGKLVAVGVMEVTRVDKDKEVNQQYLRAIRQRFEERDVQAQAARKVAAALGTKAYIVLFREDCSEFWLYDLTETKGWYHLSPERMEKFLESL
jgi:tryptophan 2,3-dioxygenase